MEDSRKILEEEIKRLLEDSKAENDALKKLILALQEEEMKMKKNKEKSGESSPKNNIK
ncbi:MAG: hypothetical protein NT040_11665 [Bacteroidetes bacterium]|nr:hypothetical protein [Bacteroidota bacterium]